MAMRQTLLLLLAAWCPASPLCAQGEFINPGGCTAQLPAYIGERYEDLVPDTLDLAESAKLAILGLTGPLDPRDDYSLYWLVNFHNRPAIMKKEEYDNLGAKFRESLPLLRLITGSDINAHVDAAWLSTLDRMTGPDGLLYAKKRDERPFFTLGGCGTGRIMGAMMVYHALDGNPDWLERVRRMVDRYAALATYKEDYAYFPRGNFLVGAAAEPEAPMPIGIWAVDGVAGRIVQPLGQYYALTHYEPAKELGDRLVNYLLHHAEFYGPEGQWLTDKLDPAQYPGREHDVHFGTHSHTLLYITDYAIHTGNQALVEYCRKSFDWAIDRNSTIPGQCDTATRIGFFLEYLNPYYPTAEICGCADMIAIGIKLSAAGAGDYWDEVEGWVRNHFITCQLTSADWVARLRSPHWPRPPQAGETDERVADRNVGAFLSWPVANDGCPPGLMQGDNMVVNPGVSIGIMHCCTGNATRTLYYVWQQILEADGQRLTVNLLLNRASPWADVYSYIPYQGRVELRIKQPLEEVTVRIPHWVTPGSDAVHCTVDAAARDMRWAGRYVCVGAVAEGARIDVTFPLPEETLQRRIYGEPLETILGGVVYDTLIFRGDTLVRIDPPGRGYPLYLREHYRQDEPRFRKVQRFVPDRVIAY
jgi:hypothetical protein